MMMIKLLILSVSLFALASAVDSEPDIDLTDGRPFGNYQPVPVDEPLLKAAIKAKKPQIVDKVSQFYENITENAGIQINLAEKKTKIGFSFPPVYKYQANLTVLAFRTVPGPGIDYPVYAEIVSFNVTIVVYDYGGADTKFTNLQFVGFPGLEEDPKKEDDLPEGRKFSLYKQVPNNDIVLERALNATKGELVEKVGKEYPTIGLFLNKDTKIRVNLAEKKINLDNDFPPIYKYQANITLLAIVDIGFPGYVPLLSFNVTIVVWNYGGEDTTKYKNLTLIGLPDDLDKKPSLESILADPRRQDPELGDRGLSAYQPLATNDSILKQAIKSVKAELVLKVVKLYPNATYSPKITINSAEKKTPMDYAFPAYYKYQANITLFAVESSNPAVLSHLDHALIFTQIVTFNITIIGTTYGAESAAKYDKLRIVGLPGYVEPEEQELYLNNSRGGGPDLYGPFRDISVNDTGLLTALGAVQSFAWTKISNVTKWTQVPFSNPSKDFVLSRALFWEPKDQTTSTLNYKYRAFAQLSPALYKEPFGPQYSFYIDIQASFSSGKITFTALKFQELGGVPPKPAPVIPDLKGPAPHRDVTEDLKDAIINLKDAISDLKESKKPTAPADLQINDLLPKDLPEVVDNQDVKRLLEAKLRTDIVSTANYLNHLEGNEVVAPSYAEIGYGPISQKTVQLPFKIFPPIFKRTYTVTGASVQLPIVPFTVFAKNLTLELSELRRNLTFDGPLNIYAEKLVRVNSYLLPDKKADEQPSERPFDLPKPLPSSSDDLL